MNEHRLFFEVTSSEADEILAQGLRPAAFRREGPYLEFFEDRGIAVGRARLLARTGEGASGKVVVLSIGDEEYRKWRQWDWREGEIDSGERNGLIVGLDDLQSFAVDLVREPEIVGSYV